MCATTCVKTPIIQLTNVAAKGAETTMAYINSAGCITSGTTSAGFTWAGTTASGVGTYVSATCICSNPNMTFDGSSLAITGNVKASTYVCSPTITGSTKVCSPIIYSTNYICSAGYVQSGCYLCAGTCIWATTCITGTVLCATTCFVGSGAGLTGTAASLKSNDSSCLGGALANTYAPLEAPAFTTNAKITHASNPYLALCKTAATAHLWYLQADGDILELGKSSGCGIAIDVNGNVGIGTVAPGGMLEIATQDTIVCPAIRFRAHTNQAYGLDFDQEETNTGYFALYSVRNNVRTLGLTQSWSSTGNGNVGIGTTTPSTILHISGTAPILRIEDTAHTTPAIQLIRTGAGYGDWQIVNDTADLKFQTGSDDTTFPTNNVIFCNNGNAAFTGIVTAVDHIATSDCRLKTCIKPIIGALSTVMQLQGVSYELCDDEKHENNIGLIAQDVLKVLPEIVSHTTPSEEDFKYGICDDKLGLKYNKLSAVLIESIKTLKKEVEEQQKQIDCLRYDLNYYKNYNC